jgi:predicted metal-dependent peptidase
MFLSIQTNGQIKIDDVGDGWKDKVIKSIENIHKHDTLRYHTLMNVCDLITFWNGQFSTTQDSSVIMLSHIDMESNSIDDISAAIIHEMYHLSIKRKHLKMDENLEEYYAYEYELDFLLRIPYVENYLIKHCLEMMYQYRN